MLISGFLYLTESVISTFGSHLVVYMGIDTISWVSLAISSKKVYTLSIMFWYLSFCFGTFFFQYSGIRGGSRTVATSKMELIVIIVNGFQSLTIIKNCSILHVAAVLDTFLGNEGTSLRKKTKAGKIFKTIRLLLVPLRSSCVNYSFVYVPETSHDSSRAVKWLFWKNMFWQGLIVPITLTLKEGAFTCYIHSLSFPLVKLS